jgi:hypothetical protein
MNDPETHKKRGEAHLKRIVVDRLSRCCTATEL